MYQEGESADLYAMLKYLIGVTNGFVTGLMAQCLV